jgi:hypothetical protein
MLGCVGSFGNQIVQLPTYMRGFYHVVVTVSSDCYIMPSIRSGSALKQGSRLCICYQSGRYSFHQNWYKDAHEELAMVYMAERIKNMIEERI